MTKTQLAESFTDRLLVDYYQWRETLSKGTRRGIRYKGMVTRLGGVETMKRLLRSASNERKAKVFGAEHWVLDPRFRTLFSGSELQRAKARLKKLK